LRAVAFVLHETRRGHDPRESLARRVLEGQRRAASREAPDAEAKAKPPCRPFVPTGWPRPFAPAPAAAGREPFAFCAGTQSDEDAAGRLAAAEVLKVEARLQRIATTLRDRLTAEAERQGTADGEQADPTAALGAEAAALGRVLHLEGGR